MVEIKNNKQVSVAGLIGVGAFFTALFSIISIADSSHRYLSLLTHFKLQYLVASIVCLVLLCWLRHFKAALFMLIITVLNGYYIAPWFIGNKAQGTTELKIVLSNVNSANRHFDKVVQLVNDETPDVFIVQEVNNLWLEKLHVLQAKYPYHNLQPRADNFGIALYSRYPLDVNEVVYWGNSNLPSLKVRLKVAEKAVTIITSHPLPPIGEDYFNRRNAQLIALGKVANEIDTPIILIGDMNVTMWSSHYEPLLADSTLRNARQGFGILPSWPTNIPFAMIPIDQCLVSEDVGVVDFNTGPDIGSDHLPLIVEFTLNSG